MNLISDKDGVDVIIPPVSNHDGVYVNLDFNFSEKVLYALDNRTLNWNLRFRSGKDDIGSARFTAFQFMADGIERRTISLHFLEIYPRQRGKKKSYDVAQAIVDTVKEECDEQWGEVSGKPVLFIEKKDLIGIPPAEREGIFAFLKKIAEKIFGFDPQPQPIPKHDLVVTPIGEDISIQLIKGHLQRSAKAEDRNPSHNRK